MLDAIASDIAGDRPGRSEPRKRRVKPVALLRGRRKAYKVETKPKREQLEFFQNEVIEVIATQRLRA